MKANKAILFFLLLTPFLAAKAQTTSSSSHEEYTTYVQDEDILNELEAGAVEIISDGSSISKAKVRELLSEKNNTKVHVNTAPARTTPLQPAEVFGKVKKSTVIFFSAHQHKDGSTHTNAATGYMISTDGVCVTNFHVLDGYAKNAQNKSLQIRTADGKVYPVVDVLSASEQNDVAIVRIDTGAEKMTALPLGEPTPAGGRVYVLSHPTGMFYYFSEGVIARYHQYGHDGTGRLLMAITADYARGSSGGPVVNRFGNLAGMVSATRSIYYEQKQQKNLQMVVKNTVPVAAIKQLIAE